MRAWIASLAVHGALVGLTGVGLAVWSEPSRRTVFTWDVALAPSGTEQTAREHPANAPPAHALQPPQAAPAAPDRMSSAPAIDTAPSPEPQAASDLDLPPSPPLPEAAGADVPPVEANVEHGEASHVNGGAHAVDWSALWRQIERLKRYPSVAQRNGWEGEVIIKATIGQNGSFVHAEIEKSSGYRILDQEALRLVQFAALPTVDQPRPPDPMTIFVPITYRLQR